MHAIRRRLDDGQPLLRRDDVLAQRLLVHRALRPWLGVRDLGGHVVHCHRRTSCVPIVKYIHNGVIDHLNSPTRRFNRRRCVAINWSAKRNRAETWRCVFLSYTATARYVVCVIFTLDLYFTGFDITFSQVDKTRTLSLACNLNFFFVKRVWCSKCVVTHVHVDKIEQFLCYSVNSQVKFGVIHWSGSAKDRTQVVIATIFVSRVYKLGQTEQQGSLSFRKQPHWFSIVN